MGVASNLVPGAVADQSSVADACKLAAILAINAGGRYELAMTMVPSSGPGNRAAAHVNSVQHSMRNGSTVIRWSENHNDENA
jgi:hypothetical protein